MILCPTCQQAELKDLRCLQCDTAVEVVNGIPYFHPHSLESFEDHSQESLQSHLESESKHFWFQYRYKIILKAFRKFVRPGARSIEIGGGTGGVSEYLTQNDFPMAVAEIQTNGLEFAKKRGLQELYQFDLFKSNFENEFDAVGMFDVLEHLGNDVLALQQVHRMLRPGGHAIVTVPSHMWLWNRRDVLEKHKRRYEFKELRSKFEENGFDVLYGKFFFVLVLPLLLLRSLLSRGDQSPITKQEILDSLKINPMFNQVLSWIMTFELWLYPLLPNLAGGSLIMVARKK